MLLRPPTKASLGLGQDPQLRRRALVLDIWPFRGGGHHESGGHDTVVIGAFKEPLHGTEQGPHRAHAQIRARCSADHQFALGAAAMQLLPKGEALTFNLLADRCYLPG